MEKTLREELEEKRRNLMSAFHEWQTGAITSQAYNLYAAKFIDDVLSLLSQHIKAKALTDEQIKSIKKQAFEEWSESPEYSQAWSGGEFSFRQLRDQIYDRAIAAAQLQAVLGELSK